MDRIYALPDSISAFYLLDIANLHGSPRIEVMAADTPKDETLTPCSSTTTFFSAVTYESVACVLSQFHKKVKHTPRSALMTTAGSV